MNTKDTNPKDAMAVAKPPFSTVSMPVMMEVGTAMMEGARKYGRHNYRTIGVRASVYFDACMRHMFSWWEGEDIDPDSDLSHVTKAIATLMVLRDAMLQDMLNDDRPPKAKTGWIGRLKGSCQKLLVKYPDCVPAFTEIGKQCREAVPDREIILDELVVNQYLCPHCGGDQRECTCL